MRFLDAHHHLWDLERHGYPWLQGRPVEAHFGAYGAICRTYAVADFRADAAAVDLVGSVHVEAGIAAGERLAESVWLQEQHALNGLPSAAVAAVSLDADDAPDQLERQAAIPLVRGVRDMLFPPGTAHGPDALAGSRLFDPAWRAGYARLARHRLRFDLQAPPPAMAAAADLLLAHPDVPAVLTHLGPPFDRSSEGRDLWRHGIRALARVPHLAVKISGLPMTDWTWSEASLRPFVLEAIDVFGPDRCMVGSNFPVDGLFGTYGDLIGAYWRITAGFSDDEREAMFAGNAARFYGIDLTGGR